MSHSFATTSSAPAGVPIRWPSLRELLHFFDTRPSNLGRRLALHCVMLRARRHRALLERGLAPTPLGERLLGQGPAGFAPLYKAFIDKRLGLRARFEQYHHNLVAAGRLFGALACAGIAAGQRVVLLRCGDFSVELGHNENCLQEGLWSLSLRDAQGLLLSHLSFSLLNGARLLVGSVQGPKLRDEQALAGIRHATHRCHGLRPPYLLLIVLKQPAARWGLSLQGVEPAHKARKRRFTVRRDCLFFDYRGFWAANGGVLGRDGRWHLALAIELRDPADAPAKKRAMYKRRAELVADMPTNIAAALRQG